MGLVDLRGRDGELSVRSLLQFAHGSPTSLKRSIARYRDGSWMLIGWEEGGEVVACLGLERDERRDLILHSLAVTPGHRHRGIGRALIDAVAEVATTRQLVAETDAEAASFYSRCGFTVEQVAAKVGRARFRCVRSIEARPAATQAVAALTLAELEEVIRAAWGRDTSDDPNEWSEENRARGQCCATALLVRELLGGEILIANVLRDGQRVDRHAWNRLPSGLTFDLTRSQFANGEQFEEPTVGEPIVTRPSGCELLAARVRKRLSLPGR